MDKREVQTDEAEGEPGIPTRRPIATRLKIAAGVLSGVALAGGLLAAGTIVLHARADSGAQLAVVPPVQVHTLTVERRSGVTRDETYIGRVEAARQIHLAFERAGTVTEVLAEEGEPVMAGAVVARLDTDLLDARRAELVAERKALDADVELARLTMTRQKELQKHGHASAQRYDEARLGHSRLQAERARLDAAIRSIDVDLAKSVLTAPFDGEVTGRQLDEGAVVSPGTPVIDLIENGRPQARVGLPEAVAGHLRAGDPVTVGAGDGAMTATVAAVRADIDPRTRTRIVLLDLPRMAAAFGSAVQVVIGRPVEAPGYWVPVSALREGRRGLWTLTTVVTGDGGPVAGAESVEVLFLDGDRAYVHGTLADGAEIVADGNHRLVPGSPLVRATGG